MCAVIDAFIYQYPHVFSYPPHMLLIGSRIKARLHNPNGLALVPHPEDKNSSLVLVADSGSHVVRKCPVRVCAHTCMHIDYTHAQKRWGLCVSLASNRRADMCICLRLCAWDCVCVGVSESVAAPERMYFCKVLTKAGHPDSARMSWSLPVSLRLRVCVSLFAPYVLWSGAHRCILSCAGAAL